MINRGLPLKNNGDREVPSENEAQDLADRAVHVADWEIPPSEELFERTVKLLSNIELKIFGHELDINVRKDDSYIDRVTIQIQYSNEWVGRRFLINGSMSDEEIILTAYLAFEVAVKHETLKGFKYNGENLFDLRNLFKLN